MANSSRSPCYDIAMPTNAFSLMTNTCLDAFGSTRQPARVIKPCQYVSCLPNTVLQQLVSILSQPTSVFTS